MKAISSYIHDVVVYMAGFVEKCFRKRINSITCIAELDNLALYSDVTLIDCKNFQDAHTGPIKPTRVDIAQLCEIVEKQIALHKLGNTLIKEIFHKVLLLDCFKKVKQSIFEHFYDDPGHCFKCPYDRYFLIKYLKI